MLWAQNSTEFLQKEFGFSDQTPHSVPLDQLIPGCPHPDCIPSLDKPTFVPVNEATFLKDEDTVLGVVIGGEAKAYPVGILTYHEIVNDIVGGTPVAVTYCPLCGSGVAYFRVIDGEAVEFGVSGVLYNSDLVMYDRKTKSLWDQIKGAAIVGPLLDKELELVPMIYTDWKQWRESYPNSTVLSDQTGFKRDYSKNPYGDYQSSADLKFPIQHFSPDLHPKSWVYGLRDGEKAVALKADWLENRGNLKLKLNGRKILVEVQEDGRVTAIDVKTEASLAIQKMFWFAWSAAHPKTKLKGAVPQKGLKSKERSRRPPKRLGL